MAIIGISLIVASVVLFCLRPPAWLPNLLANLSLRRISGPPPRSPPSIEQPEEEQQQQQPEEDQHDEPSAEEADPEGKGWVSLSQSSPRAVQEEPLVEILVTDTSEQDLEMEDVHTEDSREDDIREDGIQTMDEVEEELREEAMLDVEDDDEDEGEEDEEEEQTTPKAIITPRDDPVLSLVLPELSSIPTEPLEDNSPRQSTPSFTMTPPPAFHIEPAASSNPAYEREPDVVPQKTPPSFTMTPPPAFNIESHSEPEVDVAPPQVPPPQLNFTNSAQQPSTLPPVAPTPELNLVAPEQPSPSMAPPPPQPELVSAPPTKSPSDLMPPPPKPKLPKPRTSHIPLPASSSSSSPARRIASLTSNGRSSPSPSRIPSPPTASRTRSPTPAAARAAAPGTPSPTRAPATPASTTAPAPTGNRIPTLSGLPRRSSPTPSSRTLPIPKRGGPVPASSSSSSNSNNSAAAAAGLMPPPTATSIPKKPSRQVRLQPGHSPLDWARLAQTPTSDLRNLPPHTPYLRVTPSLLAQHNGRKGRDAWSAFGGRVYNITPYVAFHPGGGPELLRGAGKDGTRLFAEVHPWVNYETMLQSCLIGLLVEEGEASGGDGAMEEMD